MSKGHAIMISVPYQGHINPYTNLALKLASNGFTVTFAHLQHVHHKLSKAHLNGDDHEEVVDYDYFSEARLSGLDIRYTTISDGFPLEFDREAHFEEYWESMLTDFPARVDEFVGKLMININRSSSKDLVPPFLLVTDTVYPWPQTISDKYDLVNVSFWTQPALVYSLLYHWDLLTDKGHFPCKDKTDEIDYIPGVKPINAKDLMPVLKDHPEGLSNVVYRIQSISFAQVKKADLVIHNTVEELESDVISALNKYQPNYAIGPIGFSKNLPTTTVRKSLWSESDCTDWLESKPPGSVLYVSFGSFVHTSKQIIRELAYGLLLSEVNFIWAVRDGITLSDDSDVFPVGFEDEIKDKGLIVPWCDQIRVLSSPVVGGFLTHNGWNSTMESMWCGVPMICYPMDFDQITNRKLVVDDWKMGISLCDDGDCVDRIEVARKIKSLMRSGDGVGLRVNANKVKDVMRKAMEIDGPSEKSFDRFVEDLESKLRVKTTTFAINQQPTIPVVA